jgi:ligand-binding SRPBCC domain-containing protein
VTLYRLEKTQVLPTTLKTAWSCFSDPRNQPRITPPWLGVTVTSDLPDRMYAGMIAVYRVRPLPFLPVTWVTEITHVDEPYYFVDEQRCGPYRFWHHRHHFREVTDGVEMRDQVSYLLPYGLLGNLGARYVARRLEAIFAFRSATLAGMTWLP